ncbi:MAG: hypothetical protein EOP04_05515 [Proteobacteria bacterium]|nr:MAG: hypothetical protein EOP04_05515 [Pseudomonadota bacterium]
MVTIKSKTFIPHALALTLSGPSIVLADAARPVSIGTTDAPGEAQDWSSEDMTTVNFIKGGSALTEAETLNLKALYQKALRTHSIGKIRVLTWADKDVLKDEKVVDGQVTLAQKRADVIKDMLSEMSQKPVEIHNMAADKKASELSTAMETKGGSQRAVVIFEKEKSPGIKAFGR